MGQEPHPGTLGAILVQAGQPGSSLRQATCHPRRETGSDATRQLATVGSAAPVKDGWRKQRWQRHLPFVESVTTAKHGIVSGLSRRIGNFGGFEDITPIGSIRSLSSCS